MDSRYGMVLFMVAAGAAGIVPAVIAGEIWAYMALVLAIIVLWQETRSYYQRRPEQRQPSDHS